MVHEVQIEVQKDWTTNSIILMNGNLQGKVQVPKSRYVGTYSFGPRGAVRAVTGRVLLGSRCSVKSPSFDSVTLIVAPALALALRKSTLRPTVSQSTISPTTTTTIPGEIEMGYRAFEKKMVVIKMSC